MTTRWGIVGTGTIAGELAAALAEVDGVELAAVGSRRAATAQAFAAEHHAPRAHGSYAALFADEEVDVVYVATPHALHRDNTLAALDAGKAVLCEKPFAIRAGEAREMVARARQRGCFLMEAVWTRLLPLVVELKRRLDEGALGAPRMLTADFGFRGDLDPSSILFRPELGGGALLDVGAYPVWLAHLVWGAPERVVAMADLGASGVDEQSAALLGWPGGALAVLSSAIRTETQQEAFLCGTEAQLQLHRPWWRPERMTIRRDGQPDEVVERPIRGGGYAYEILEVERCLAAGLLESPALPWADSVARAETLDRIRAAMGLRYPME